MCPSLIQIGSKTAEKNSAQTNKQTDRQTDTTKIMVTWPWTNIHSTISQHCIISYYANHSSIQILHIFHVCRSKAVYWSRCKTRSLQILCDVCDLFHAVLVCRKVTLERLVFLDHRLSTSPQTHWPHTLGNTAVFPSTSFSFCFTWLIFRVRLGRPKANLWYFYGRFLRARGRHFCRPPAASKHRCFFLFNSQNYTMY